MFKRIIQSVFMLAATALSIESYGQAYVSDAGRFSSSTLQGTARIQALGGAQHALGGDMSTLAGNPAGLGVYRKSEFGFTSALQIGRTQNTYTTPSDVTQTISNRNNFNIPSFAFIINNEESITSNNPWKGGSWGISFTRTNDFQNRRKFSGRNNVNSLRHGLIDRSFGIDTSAYNFDNLYYDLNTGGNTLSGILEGNSDVSDLMAQGYWSDLFYYENGSYRTFDDGVPVTQTGEILTKGSQSQWDIGYGANFMDRLYVGADLGIGLLRYIEETDYSETLDPGAQINTYNTSQTLDQRGTGLFLKAGFIYRITDYVRIASTIQTPTWYFITEDYESSLYADWNGTSPFVGYETYDFSTRAGEFQYNFRSPMRWTSGISAFLGKLGFITADFEYVPYKQAKFSSFDADFSTENAAIKDLYKNVWNMRFGGELRYKNIFFRGGYALIADPVNSSNNVDRSKEYITGGIGIRLENHHFDFTLVNESYESYYSHYTMNDGSEPYTVSKTTNVRGVLTWGVYLY